MIVECDDCGKLVTLNGGLLTNSYVCPECQAIVKTWTCGLTRCDIRRHSVVLTDEYNNATVSISKDDFRELLQIIVPMLW